MREINRRIVIITWNQICVLDLKFQFVKTVHKLFQGYGG